MFCEVDPRTPFEVEEFFGVNLCLDCKNRVIRRIEDVNQLIGRKELSLDISKLTREDIIELGSLSELQWTGYEPSNSKFCAWLFINNKQKQADYKRRMERKKRMEEEQRKIDEQRKNDPNFYVGWGLLMGG